MIAKLLTVAPRHEQHVPHEETPKRAFAPLLIGPKNAELVTGCSWEWCRDQAVRLGVPLLGTIHKNVINAAAFLAALEADRPPLAKTSAMRPADAANDALDPAAEVRARLGVRRRA